MTFDEETERPDPERLAARVARAFLGVRLDCAQCHDHPFQPWKQDDFRGLAAFFGGVHSNLRGIHDGEGTYQPLDRKTKKPIDGRGRACRSDPSCCPATGTPREQLAAWVVDPRNPNLARATVNRVWALLFGRPLVEPVDDLPTSGDLPPALELLAADFSAHGYDLHRLIRIIAATEAFRLDSADAADGRHAEHDETWAAFPMTRLRPEQVAGGDHPGGLAHDPRRRVATGSSGSSPTPAATTSSTATATPARTSSTPGAARSPSGSC